MKIIHIAAEIAPIAKVGGLADVVQGLSSELIRDGHDVIVILPKYDILDISKIENFKPHYKNIKSWYKGEWHNNTVWSGKIDGITLYLIESHHPSHFFNRGCLYGCEDDLERFLYWSRACLDFLFAQNITPEIIHLHDWQTAAIALLYRDIFQPKGYTIPKIVMTIHNLAYQGLCKAYDLDAIGLDGNSYMKPDLIQDSTYPEAGNLLKGAIIYSNYITTVSPRYAKEVLEPEYGMTLDPVLKRNIDKFKGILNGIDYHYWNPETDPYIAANFSSKESSDGENGELTIHNKAYVKKILRDRLMLNHAHKPLVGCICRLVPQKGIEFIKHIIKHVDRLGIQFVLLGVSPIPEIDTQFHELKHFYEENPNIYLRLHHHEELAHMIFAASDIFIVPSLFEPCGLTQMIALRYGSIPLVRETGGLADTIFDINRSEKPFHESNGFTFVDPNVESFESALKRAIAYWYHHPQLWRALVIQGMKIDFSWEKPAKEYLNTYQNLL